MNLCHLINLFAFEVYFVAELSFIKKVINFKKDH